LSAFGSLVIDHVFYIANDSARAEAAAMARIGLEESCRRTHAGLGTSNIFFCFDNAFLEIIWVDDESEAKVSSGGDAILARDRLLRDKTAALTVMPFGIGMRTETPDGPLPFETVEYPVPLASGMKNSRRVARSATDTSQPYLFRAQRNRPPSEWTDGLAGRRQRRLGYAEIVDWQFIFPAGVTPGPDILRLRDLGALTIAAGQRPGLSVGISRADGGPVRRLHIPGFQFD